RAAQGGDGGRRGFRGVVVGGGGDRRSLRRGDRDINRGPGRQGRRDGSDAAVVVDHEGGRWRGPEGHGARPEERGSENGHRGAARGRPVEGADWGTHGRCGGHSDGRINADGTPVVIVDGDCWREAAALRVAVAPEDGKSSIAFRHDEAAVGGAAFFV